jgi:RecA-family ATPase
MIKAPAAVIPIVQQAIGIDHFYQHKHQVLFTDACDHFNDQGELTFPTLTQYATDVGHIQEAGGPGYIAELAIDFTAVPESVSYYIDILKDKYARRQVIKVGQQAARKAQTLADHEDTEEIFEELLTGLEHARSGLRGSLRLPELADATRFVGKLCPAKPAELVQGMVHQGSKVIIGGTSKGRKTMTLMDLAVSVATGSPWWGFPTAKGPVCYINFEIQDAFFWNRVTEICKAKGVQLEPETFMVWNLRGHGEAIENMVDDFMRVLRHKKFVLIIIDPIYKALGKRDENRAGDVASMLNELEKLPLKRVPLWLLAPITARVTKR